jgi:hypothetical protein
MDISATPDPLTERALSLWDQAVDEWNPQEPCSPPALLASFLRVLGARAS